MLMIDLVSFVLVGPALTTTEHVELKVRERRRRVRLEIVDADTGMTYLQHDAELH